MFANDFPLRLSAAIYPIMLAGGAFWGATGRPAAGFIGMVLMGLLSGIRRG